MIDVNEPLELDDGTPVEYLSHTRCGNIKVKLPKNKSVYRDGKNLLNYSWNYCIKSGVWIGDHNNSRFRLQNVARNGISLEEIGLCD
jgi:hypothetical protein